MIREKISFIFLSLIKTSQQMFGTSKMRHYSLVHSVIENIKKKKKNAAHRQQRLFIKTSKKKLIYFHLDLQSRLQRFRRKLQS